MAANNKKKKQPTPSEELISLAAKAGAEAALSKFEAQKEQERAKKNDRRLRNTKLLLKHYREFKAHSENAVYSATQSEDVIDVLDLMWDRNHRSDQIVNAIKKSAVHTHIIMAHVDGMLAVYKTFAEQSRKPADLRQYYVLCDRYINAEELTINEIAEKYNIEPRTVYLDLDVAVEKLAKMIFGVDLLSGE